MKVPALVAVCLSLVLFVVAAIGCGKGRNAPQSVTPENERQDGESSDLAKRKANLAKLSVDDRKIAEEQVYCAVTSEPLGSMGPPLKVMIDEQAVFLCCEGCREKAESDSAETLAKAKEHRERANKAASK